jgi:hypothetical protein
VALVDVSEEVVGVSVEVALVAVPDWMEALEPEVRGEGKEEE